MLWPYLLGLLFISACAGLGALLAFGTVRPGAPRAGLGTRTGLEDLDDRSLPEMRYATARDGAAIPYRYYPSPVDRTVVLIHGAYSRGRSLHGLAEHLSLNAIARCVTLDLRGHGWGRSGDLDYIGQLEDDLADLIEELARQDLARRLTLLGFSAGGTLALRFATGRYGEEIGELVLLAPYVHETSPTLRPDSGWAYFHHWRILGLRLLNALGVKAFNGLTALSFALSPEDREVTTPDYSYRMTMSLRIDQGTRAALGRLTRSGVLIVGGDDELFRPSAYPEEGLAETERLRLVVLDGVRHLGLITQPEALRAIGEEIEDLQGGKASHSGLLSAAQ